MKLKVKTIEQYKGLLNLSVLLERLSLKEAPNLIDDIEWKFKDDFYCERCEHEFDSCSCDDDPYHRSYERDYEPDFDDIHDSKSTDIVQTSTDPVQTEGD